MSHDNFVIIKKPVAKILPVMTNEWQNCYSIDFAYIFLFLFYSRLRRLLRIITLTLTLFSALSYFVRDIRLFWRE